MCVVLIIKKCSVARRQEYNCFEIGRNAEAGAILGHVLETLAENARWIFPLDSFFFLFFSFAFFLSLLFFFLFFFVFSLDYLFVLPSFFVLFSLSFVFFFLDFIPLDLGFYGYLFLFCLHGTYLP